MVTQPGREAALSGERKAAILVLLLGEEASAPLLRQLSRRDVARIAREVAALGPIERSLAERVLEEYYLDALEAPEELGGPDAARRILAQASISREIVDQLVGRGEAERDDLLGPLLEAPPDVLARALEEEHPQTTALVLLHLPPRRAAKLLSALPRETRAETVLRMATLRHVPGEVLGEVATSLHERLAARRGHEAQNSFERTVEVLGFLARHETRCVLDRLEPDHPDAVQRLRSELCTFESLVHADDRGLQEILRNVGSGKVAIALSGADPRLVQRFMANLSERAAAMLREEMEFLGTPSAPEQALVRKEILDLALKIEIEGGLTFERPPLDDGAELRPPQGVAG